MESKDRYIAEYMECAVLLSVVRGIEIALLPGVTIELKILRHSAKLQDALEVRTLSHLMKLIVKLNAKRTKKEM